MPRPDGSIILGGGQPLYRGDESVWYDMVDDGTLIEGVKERWFEGYMGRHFHGWDVDGKDEKIDRIWTGSKSTEQTEYFIPFQSFFIYI